MILTVTETNFTKKYNWIFKLKDSSGDEYYIMDSDFYKLKKLISPVGKRELDTLDTKSSISGHCQEFDGVKVVTQILY